MSGSSSSLVIAEGGELPRRGSPRTCCTWVMARAVIFDWYGTLAEWEQAGTSNYAAVLAQFGYTPGAGIFDEYHARWDGADHRAYSTSRDAYAAWTRERLAELVGDCGVGDGESDRVVEALVEADYASSMRSYPETIPTLRALRDRGLLIGVCSNWGWDLETFLEMTRVAGLVDVAVTSARAGFRKPHPGIYELVLAALGVPAGDAVFVGDSWGPDVVGPSGLGMSAVHVVRDPRQPAPELLPRSHRVSGLGELLSMTVLDEPDRTTPAC